jgi:hypothetical protein
VDARRSRRLLALVASLVIAVGQTAAAAYACTRSAASTPTASAAIADCNGSMDRGDGGSQGGENLCEVHCQSDTVPSPGVVAMAPPPGDAWAIRLPVAWADGVPARAPDAKGAAPPARERYCRLQL